MNILKGNLPTERSLVREKMYCGDVAVCPRKAVLHLFVNDGTESVSLSSNLYMTIGTAIHDVVTKQMDEMGILIAKELYLSDVRIGPPKFGPIGGYVDAIITWKDEPTIVEIKSCGQLPTKPKLWHQYQAAAYSVLTGIDNSLIHYVSRKVADFLDVIQVTFEVDNSLIKVAAENMATATICANLGILPPIPEYLTKGKCGFCPFIPKCWDDSKNVMKFRKLKSHEGRMDENAIEELADDLLYSRTAMKEKLLERL